MDNIVNDAVHCPNCGASLLTPGNWDAKSSAPQQQYQQPQPQQAAPQYQQPPQQYYPPQPTKGQRVATVKNVGLTEILFLFSGFILVAAGFENLGYLTVRFIPGAYILLGLIALVGGFLMLAAVIMPNLIKGMDNILGLMMLGLSALFVLWGWAATFGDNIGVYGGLITAAGLAGLAGCGLKMGYLK